MCRLCEHCQGLFWKHSGTEWVTLNYRTVAEGQWAEKKKKKPPSSAFTNLPNGCHSSRGTVGGWGSTRLLLVVRLWALCGVR